MAHNASSAGSGPQETRDHFHGRGLAGTVRAQKAQHLAWAHREREIIHGQALAEAAAQGFNFDHDAPFGMDL
jgi:hypothetical protein